jgi:hypothetical protein
MSEIWFTAREKFNARSGERWTKFIAWANLPQLTELITLDELLCPSVVDHLTPEDWAHNVQQDNHILFFRDLDYLLTRVREFDQPTNILAVTLEPVTETGATPSVPRFVFKGYDLIDQGGNVSALTNCRGFDRAFSNTDISEIGLLTGFRYAKEVQARLRHHYAHESHANCDLWAIWRLEV